MIICYCQYFSTPLPIKVIKEIPETIQAEIVPWGGSEGDRFPLWWGKRRLWLLWEHGNQFAL